MPNTRKHRNVSLRVSHEDYEVFEEVRVDYNLQHPEAPKSVGAMMADHLHKVAETLRKQKEED